MKKPFTLLIVIFIVFSSTAILAATVAEKEAPLTLMSQPHKTKQSTQKTSTSPDSNILRDIHGPVAINTYPPYLLIGGAVFLLLLLLALVYWLIKKRKKSGPPPIPPWQKALTELTDARKLFSTHQSLLYMGRISQILRHYIESRFAIHSTRQTTEEFLHSLQDVQDNVLLQKSQDELQCCLEQCDLAKFAHRIPDKKIMTQMEEAVTTFVHKTTPTNDQKGGNA